MGSFALPCQNNCANQIRTIIIYRQEMPKPNLDYFVRTKSEYVLVQKDDNLTVPNFVGGSLPQSDHSDREYYCSIMTTLFKPWRTGNN